MLGIIFEHKTATLQSTGRRLIS